MSGGLWRIDLTVPQETVSLFALALEPFGESLAWYETPSGWRVEVLAAARPSGSEVAAALAEAARAAGLAAAPRPGIFRLADKDWLAENRRDFPLIRAGRFLVRGSHHPEAGEEGCLPILMDAGRAFGTGTHGSTRGCLLALDGLAARASPRSMFDLGCGSGILAIAMARLWEGPVLGADNDPDSVAASAENAVRNGLGGRIRFVASEGFAAAEIAEAAPFDLIAANILLEPLVALALRLAAHLAPGGRAVLSGILNGQAGELEEACRTAGLGGTERVEVEGWTTLVMRRPD